MFFHRDTALPPYLPLPRFLLTSGLSVNAKLLYGLLLSRTQLSQKNGWVTEEGYVYVIYPIAELAEDLGRSGKTVTMALGELQQAGLILRVRQGRNRANRILLRLPDEGKLSSADGRGSSLPDREETSAPDVKNLPASKNDRNKNKQSQNKRERPQGEKKGKNYDQEYEDKGDCL